MFKVYDGKPKKKDVFLTLQDGGCNSIELVAVDETGQTFTNGRILKVNPDGKIERFLAINPGLGIKTNHKGQIEIVD